MKLEKSTNNLVLFDQCFSDWANIASSGWGYPQPSNEFYEKFKKRMPEGIRTILGQGIEEGIIIPFGQRFSLNGLFPVKGRYSWFSKYTSLREPAPNWEYFIHVAMYTKLYPFAINNNLTLKFEDKLMDLTIHVDKKLIVCIEVKENANQIEKLLTGIRKYQSNVDLLAFDRGNDPLRKAKYIIRSRPEYFCLRALGERIDFAVSYGDHNSFELTKDFIPFIP